MARVYTRTGDDGTTGLIGGVRVSKDSLRIDAYGSVDELNSVLGVVRSCNLPGAVGTVIGKVQDDLFIIGADLALPPGADRGKFGTPAITGAAIAALEEAINNFEQDLAPLQKFILPGGTTAGAALHFARTVARRAERCCVALARSETVDPQILRYLNRLSDLCFVLARFVNHEAHEPEFHPTFGRKDPGPLD